MNEDLHKLADELLTMRFAPIPVRRTSAGVPHRMEWPRGERPNYGGVYAFWWKRGRKHLLETIQNRTIAFHGPGGKKAKDILLDVTPEHFNEIDGRVPLYIGKTHGGKTTHLAKRVGLHLLLKTKRAVKVGRGNKKVPRKNTSCQVRDRLDRLLHKMPDPRNLILDNLALSFVRVEKWETRFFLEDLAIGLYRPLFNLDCER